MQAIYFHLKIILKDEFNFWTGKDVVRVFECDVTEETERQMGTCGRAWKSRSSWNSLVFEKNDKWGWVDYGINWRKTGRTQLRFKSSRIPTARWRQRAEKPRWRKDDVKGKRKHTHFAWWDPRKEMEKFEEDGTGYGIMDAPWYLVTFWDCTDNSNNGLIYLYTFLYIIIIVTYQKIYFHLYTTGKKKIIMKNSTFSLVG